jgi:PLP dependent protein
MSNDQPHSQETPNESHGMPALRVDPSRLSILTANISSIQSRISSAVSSSRPPRLVAVSKLKPATDILALHTSEQKQLHFGENYVQELLEKSKLLWQHDNGAARGIRWHFIGGLQSNKAVALARDVQGLWCVESVDSVKKAKGLDKGWGEKAADAKHDDKLRVFIQVNTSGEENKSGVEPESDELLEIAKCITDDCGHLQLQGLMTIGAIARSKASSEGNENEDFVSLKQVRSWLAEKTGCNEDALELSMGMSEDFESAIRLGSSEVRIGSTIFGERPPKSEAKVV